MTKYSNLPTGQQGNTTNKAGGTAFTMTHELELVTLLLTSFMKNKFYESEDDQLKRLKKLTTDIADKKFIMQAAIYARNEFGMRSVTHALVGELLTQIKGEKAPWLKYGISAAIYRPDDIYEIVGYYLHNHTKVGYSKGLPAALRKAISYKLNTFDKYQLAKYKNEGGNIKLVDIFNLVHPKANKDHEDIFQKIVKGTLKNTQTWEAKLSKAGQVAKTEEAKAELKDKAWKELAEAKRMPYFALLRNLRNLITQSPEALKACLDQLVDPVAIKKSLVLPFRFITAIEEIEKLQGEHITKVLNALNKATEAALSNVPVFKGRTLVAVDMSGSMAGQPLKIASLFAAAILKKNPDNSDLIAFNDQAYNVNIRREDGMLTMSERIQKLDKAGGGTNFSAMFGTKEKYDRIIILSDMQSWQHETMLGYDHYKKTTQADPYIHCIDLVGNGTMQFPANKICTLAGYSDKVFDMLQFAETDKNILLNTIKNIKF